MARRWRDAADHQQSGNRHLQDECPGSERSRNKHQWVWAVASATSQGLGQKHATGDREASLYPRQHRLSVRPEASRTGGKSVEVVGGAIWHLLSHIPACLVSMTTSRCRRPVWLVSPCACFPRLNEGVAYKGDVLRLGDQGHTVEVTLPERGQSSPH